MRTHEIFAEPWAMEPEKLAALARQVQASVEAPAAALVGSSDQGPTLFDLRGSVAVISITGTLMRRVPSWFKYYGIAATETGQVRAAVEQAAGDSRVRTILLRIDSPGGQAAGVLDAGDAIFAARSKKRVEAVVEGTAASGAYWLASQAHTISAPPDALVGSIGVFWVVADESKAAEQAGVKVHVVRSGEHKGAGVAGAPVTEGQLAMLQGLVDGLASIFTTAIARGRGRKHDQITGLATGAVWLAGDARTHGLVDRVESVSLALSRFNAKENAPMANENTTAPESTAPKAATIGELKATFPGRHEFVIAQLEAGATLEKAQSAFKDLRIKELEEQNASSVKALEEAKAAAAKPAPAPAAATTTAPVGVPPVPRGADPVATGSADFMTVAKSLAAEKGLKLGEAMSKVATAQPDLYARFRAAMNERAPEIAARKKTLGMR